MNIFCVVGMFAIFVGLVLIKMVWEGRQIDGALEAWQHAGYTVQCPPALVVRYSTHAARSSIGVLSVTDDNLIFRSRRGETEVIPLSSVRWIAAGNMWRRTIGKGKYGPHLLVSYKIGYTHETLAFHTVDNTRLGQQLSQYGQLTCQPIPRGFRVWNSRLIGPT